MELSYIRRNIFKHLKRSKILFLIFERITCRDELKAEIDSYKDKSPKSKEQVSKEKRIHNDYWHCGDFVYKRYGLAYKALSCEEILDYVPTFYHHKKLEKDHRGIDTIKYSSKLVQARLFEEKNIPCAKSLAYCVHGIWRSVNKNEEVNIEEIISKTLGEVTNKLFIKPVGGQGGDGIYVLKKNNNDYFLNGTSIKISKLNDFLSDSTYLLQEGIIQSDQANSINATSVNTLRVIVQREEQRMVMKTCSMRIGRSGSDLDNSCQGGICIRVNTLNGQLDDLAKSRFDGIVFEAHPDSGLRFKDVKINNWNHIKQIIEDESSKLVEFNNIALDVALTNDGIKLIEFNFRYGIEHQQCVLGGVRRLLNINNC